MTICDLFMIGNIMTGTLHYVSKVFPIKVTLDQ